jgi:TP901 family phage tail tape measure protein
MLVSRSIRAALEEFVEFDHQIVSAAVKFPEISKNIGAIPIRATEAFGKLQKVAREVGATTKFTAGEAAEGLNFLAMAGFNAEQSMELLPKTTELAISTNVDLARATDIATDALFAFGLATKDASKLGERLGRVNDVMAATIVSANVDMEQLFETMKFAGPVAKSVGVSIEEFAAATGIMGNAGIKGSLAGTALKNAFLRLAGPVGKAKALMKKLGIVTMDARGDFLPFADILEQVNRATAHMGTGQRGAALGVIFGKRAVAGMNILLDKGADRLRAYTHQLRNSKGMAKAMADEINKSLKNRLLQLKSALLEVGFRILESFTGEGPEALDRLIEKVRNFDVTPIVEGLREVINVLKFLAKHIDKIIFGFKLFIAAVTVAKINRMIVAFEALATAAKAAKTHPG